MLWGQEAAILFSPIDMAAPWKNRLYYGDNLRVLRESVADESVDLIYLDPPFNSNATYNVLFAEKSGRKSTAQITAFEDTWEWGEEPELAYWDVVNRGGRLADLLQAMRVFLGQNDMMAYLCMMAVRLQELYRVLKENGSLYLHCDPTASHYLKLILDAVFDLEFYRNEITWKRTTTHSDSKTWSRVADIIFFYTKGQSFTWNTPRDPHSEEYLATKYRYDDGDGRIYRLDNMTSPNPRPNMMYVWKGFPFPSKGWRYSQETMAKLDEEGRIWYPTNDDGSFNHAKRPQLKRYLEKMEGGVMGTIWTDIPPINSQARERLGYPTQKPQALLERIIAASSREGDVVLDPFCGCGTAIAGAERLKRRWIGIDITHLAVALIRSRLAEHYGTELCPYEVEGLPPDLEGARALAQEDRYKFEWWVVGEVGARPAHDNKKKGADTGVDGFINFRDDNSGLAKKIVIQVKSGHVNASMIRDLKGVREREKAEVAAFLTLEEPTKPMLQEATAAGFYKPEHFPNLLVPRVQIITVKGLFEGKQIEYPRVAPAETFKRAARLRKDDGPQQQGLLP
jgi:site-specific DNA-methyltransferase (adenine-specific)